MDKLSSVITRALRVLGLVLLFPVVSVATAISQYDSPGVVVKLPGLNKAPVVTSMSAYQIANKKFVVSGTVSDERPAGCTVTIGGSGAGQFQVSATGSFSGTVTVQNAGQLSATPNDGQMVGQPYTITLTNVAPKISNFIGVAGDGGTWTFSGQVADEAPGGLNVVLSGFPEGATANVTVGANGTFSVTVTPPANSSGTITATVTDWFGLTGTATTLYGS